MVYDKLQVPADGKKITVNPDFSLNVPAHPIIPFIEGDSTGVDITPVMRKVVDAAVAKAIQYAINNDKSSVTLVHKGNIMKFTEDAFREWGYALAQNEFGTQLIDKGPWCKFNNPKANREIVVKDVIADAIQAKTVIYDFARLMDGAQELSCSAFGEAMISHM